MFWRQWICLLCKIIKMFSSESERKKRKGGREERKARSDLLYTPFVIFPLLYFPIKHVVPLGPLPQQYCRTSETPINGTNTLYAALAWASVLPAWTCGGAGADGITKLKMPAVPRVTGCVVSDTGVSCLLPAHRKLGRRTC